MPQSNRLEQLQAQYLDQYVVVDASRPELARFRGLIGQVKTINCNGRALVQFDAQANRGWYDLEVEALQVVDKPEPPAPPAKAAPAKATAGKTDGKAPPES